MWAPCDPGLDDLSQLCKFDHCDIWQYCKSMATIRPISNLKVNMVAVLDEIQKERLYLYMNLKSL